MNAQQQETIARLQAAVKEYEAAMNGQQEARAIGAVMHAANPDALRSLLDLVREQETALIAARKHIEFMQGCETSTLAIELHAEALSAIDAALTPEGR